jgi:hypothetical protein
MKRIPIAIYSSSDEIEAIIRQLETDALALPPDSEQHRNIMKQIAKFRVYADAKRWLSPSTETRRA